MTSNDKFTDDIASEVVRHQCTNVQTEEERTVVDNRNQMIRQLSNGELEVISHRRLDYTEATVKVMIPYIVAIAFMQHYVLN